MEWRGVLEDESQSKEVDSICGDSVCSLMNGRLFLSKDFRDDDLEGSFIQRQNTPLVACDVACVYVLVKSNAAVSIFFKNELQACAQYPLLSNSLK
jgi:hypothetical protein